MNDGTIYSLQATICMPYPNTELWTYCKQNGWLLSEDWDDYHMKNPVVKLQYSQEQLKSLLKSVYRTRYHPMQIIHKLKRFKDMDDIKYGFRIFKKLAHI